MATPVPGDGARTLSAPVTFPAFFTLPVIVTAVALAGLVAPAVGQEPGDADMAPVEDTAEGLVRQLYDLVTFPAGPGPDLEAVRATFIPEAVIVLRTSRAASTVMSVDDFIADWERFIRDANVLETGFTEEITALVPTVFGDIAHVLVLYEASIPGRLAPQEGVDSFHLVRKDGRWWIAGILNEIPTPDRPVPEVLREAAGS